MTWQQIFVVAFLGGSVLGVCISRWRILLVPVLLWIWWIIIGAPDALLYDALIGTILFGPAVLGTAFGIMLGRRDRRASDSRKQGGLSESH